jgi:hypothetical protein
VKFIFNQKNRNLITCGKQCANMDASKDAESRFDREENIEALKTFFFRCLPIELKETCAAHQLIVEVAKVERDASFNVPVDEATIRTAEVVKAAMNQV